MIWHSFYLREKLHMIDKNVNIEARAKKLRGNIINNALPINGVGGIDDWIKKVL